VSKEDILRIFQAREQARSSSTPVSHELAQKAVTQSFTLWTETPVAFNVVPNSTPVRLTFEDVLNICSVNKTTGFDEDDIKGISAYVAGPDVDAESLRQIVLKVIRGVPQQWEPRFRLCCLLRSSMNDSIEDRVGPESQLKRGRALFDHMLQEQCKELLCSWNYLHPTEWRKAPPNDQLEVAQFIAHVVEEGLVGNNTLLLCKLHLSNLNMTSDPGVALRLCSLLTVLGKVLDQEGYIKYMDATFKQLQRFADDNRYIDIQKDIYVRF
jgi:hypothetical protein